jgi:hypothetical protein
MTGGADALALQLPFSSISLTHSLSATHWQTPCSCPPSSLLLSLSLSLSRILPTFLYAQLADALQLPLSALVSDESLGSQVVSPDATIPIPCLSPTLVAMVQVSASPIGL